MGDEEWQANYSVGGGQPGMLERRIAQDICDCIEREHRLHGPNLNEPLVEIATATAGEIENIL